MAALDQARSGYAPTPAGLTVAQAIDEAPLGTLQTLVIGLCFLVSTLDGLDIQALSFAATSVAHDLRLSPAQLGIVFSATLLGSIGGSYLGALADRYGRKALITAAVLIFSVFTFAGGLSRGFYDLLAFRCLAGVGLGGAVPNMIALTSEFAPRRWRSGAVTLVLWGFPIGAVGGGLLASRLILAFGWRSVFFTGAAASILLAPALMLLMPESARFLALVRPGDMRLGRLLARLRPDLGRSPSFARPFEDAVAVRRRGGAVFQPRFLPGLLLLSLAGFASLLLQYLMSSWTPLLLQRAGLSMQGAILGGMLFNAGGLVGSGLLARLVSRSARAGHVLAAAFAGGAVAVLVASQAHGSTGVLIAALTAFGVFHFGAQIAATNYAQFYFPTEVRGAGLAWVGAVSRFGALAGPLIGGQLVMLGLPSDSIFKLGAFPGLLAATSLAALAIWTRNGAAADPAIPTVTATGSSR
jgi:MFS transporter, AAHS family, 4-hydroxybenzoate transporter